MEIISKQLQDLNDLDIDKVLEKDEIFSSSKLFKCILGLNNTESKIFGYIINNKDVATAELAEHLNMDRSSIQRALQNLSDIKIINRKSMSMKQYVESKEINDVNKKGYVYVYNAEEMDLIKKELKYLLQKWYKSMLNYVENLDNLCECCGLKFENC